MKTRDRLRAEDRQARQNRVTTALTTTLTWLNAQHIEVLLKLVRADRGIALRDLDEHLAVHPDALTTGSARCPAVVIRLTRELHAAGHTAVVVPACSDCARSGIDLPRQGTNGRICQACDARNPKNKKPCARCGRTARVAARRDEGGICFSCYRTDAQVVEECANCNRVRMPVTRRANGQPLCEKCWSPPQHTCTACGRVGQAHSLGPAGALCTTCYRRLAQPRRTCGNCGRHQQIVRRATTTRPDLCWNCSTPAAVPCSDCGQVRPCTKNAHGELVCRTCRPRSTSPCCNCHRTRPVQAHWPRGPVCGACYLRVLDHPAPCHRCQGDQPLIAKDEDGRLICGPCAGLPGIYLCRSCGRGGRSYSDGRCPRCVLAARLEEHLAGPTGDVSTQLRPLLDALAGADDARGVLCWLRRSPNARLLGEVAAAGRLVSHELLDELPPSRYEHYVRQTLVHTGVLPERSEELDRIPAWLDQLLADYPPQHARLIRPFVHWFLLKRARRRATERKRPAMAATSVRTRTRVALELLTWLDSHDVTLAELTQDRLDQWLAQGNTRTYTVRYFLGWAASRSLARKLTVPTIARQYPARILDEDDRWDRLRRCLNDTGLPLDVRVAGTLILLFGLPASRIRNLRVQDLQERDGETYLGVGSPALAIPPKLAVLMHKLTEAPVRESRFTGDTAGSRWLFPGLLPGRPAAPSGFSRKLLDHGIDARPARNAALVALVEEIPPAVLADLLGIHISTAVRWADIARRDWTHYLAARDLDLDAIEAERDIRRQGNTAPSE